MLHGPAGELLLLYGEGLPFLDLSVAADPDIGEGSAWSLRVGTAGSLGHGVLWKYAGDITTIGNSFVAPFHLTRLDFAR
jgi:hypothetical protein